jgi:hypothetical protein
MTETLQILMDRKPLTVCISMVGRLQNTVNTNVVQTSVPKTRTFPYFPV